MKKYSFSNRELISFLVITFGVTIIMGFVMEYAYNKYSMESFPLVQMYYPSMGAMLALLLNKERSKKIPSKFFKTYLFFALSSIIYLLASIFVLHNNPDLYLAYWLTIGGFSLIVALGYDDKKSIEDFGLKFSKNNKLSIYCILLFIGLYLTCVFTSSLFSGELESFLIPFKNIKTYAMLLYLPLSFSFSFIVFLGEEYGWRYFLQTALQERIGKIKGVIAVGIIWGIWHLPINMYYYSPETSFYSVINQLIICISYSVFFGYVYMKTQNIWTVSIIHFINNNLGYVLYEAEGTNLIFTLETILFNLIIFAIIYMPFLLTKEYKNYYR